MQAGHVQAGQEIVTVTGWSSLVPGAPWTPTEFRLVPSALGLQPADEPAVSWIALGDVVGVDHLGEDPDGLAILEFALTTGAVAHARVPDSFVEATVAALHRNRAGTPPTYQPVPVEPEPARASEPAVGREADPEPASASEPKTEVDGTEVDGTEVDGEDEAVLVDEPTEVGIPDPPPPPKGKAGSKSALAQEVRELREYLDDLGFPERRALRKDIESLIAHRTEVLAEVRAATLARREQEVALVRVRREAVLQDVGVYRPRHPAEDSVALRDRLNRVQRDIEQIVTSGEAVSGTDDWTVNGSRAEGNKVVADLAQLLLRTYNAEADLLVATIRPYELDAAIDRLAVTLATVHRLGASMEIEISEDLHRLRVEELTIAADELALRDEARRRALDSGSLTEAGVGGHLFVTSNRGAFGPDVVRIGVTTLDDPAAVVDEVDAGRLPFPSDLHALVPCADADALLDAVRSALDLARLNLTDPRCPFFVVSPERVRDLLVDLGADVPWFVVGATAEEWRQSENARHEQE